MKHACTAAIGHPANLPDVEDKTAECDRWAPTRIAAEFHRVASPVASEIARQTTFPCNEYDIGLLRSLALYYARDLERDGHLDGAIARTNRPHAGVIQFAAITVALFARGAPLSALETMYHTRACGFFVMPLYEGLAESYRSQVPIPDWAMKALCQLDKGHVAAQWKKEMAILRTFLRWRAVSYGQFVAPLEVKLIERRLCSVHMGQGGVPGTNGRLRPRAACADNEAEESGKKIGEILNKLRSVEKDRDDGSLRVRVKGRMGTYERIAANSGCGCGADMLEKEIQKFDGEIADGGQLAGPPFLPTAYALQLIGRPDPRLVRLLNSQPLAQISDVDAQLRECRRVRCAQEGAL
jgi:hypothetical protein